MNFTELFPWLIGISAIIIFFIVKDSLFSETKEQDAEARRMTNKRYRAVKEAHLDHLQQFADKTSEEVRQLMKDKVYLKSTMVNGYRIRIKTENHLNSDVPHLFVTTCPDTFFGRIFRLEDTVHIK